MTPAKNSPWRGEVVLRAPTFSIPGLHPDQTRGFHIVQEDQNRIGLLSGRVLSDVKVAPGRVRDLGDLRIPESKHEPVR